jgi:putative transposase
MPLAAVTRSRMQRSSRRGPGARPPCENAPVALSSGHPTPRSGRRRPVLVAEPSPCPRNVRISDSTDKPGRISDVEPGNLLTMRGREVGRELDSGTGMSLPRQVLPGQFYMVTRRCTQRQFLLRPDAETNNAFTYCLIEAAQRFEIDVILPCALSNHYHAVVFDRCGRYPEFLEHFHKLFARCQNALRGRWENFWASEQVCVVKLVGREDVLDKLVYTAINPVKDGLVDRVDHWPGVNGLRALLTGRCLRAERPRHFFRRDGAMPAAVEMKLTIPSELGSETGVLEELRQRVAAAVDSIASERMRTGQRVYGRRAVLRQSWWARPTSVEPRRNLRPQVAARSKWARIETLLRNRAFLAEYAAARTSWQEGAVVTFPIGTYWLRRFANVPIAARSFGDGLSSQPGTIDASVGA